MTSAKCSIFLLFWDYLPPPTVDVIYGSPLINFYKYIVVGMCKTLNDSHPNDFISTVHLFQYLLTAAFKAYGLAWTSHFFIEHNKPATFKYPIFSFIGDHKMFVDLSTMRLCMW